MKAVTLTIKNNIEISYHDENLDNFIYDSLTIPNPKYLENMKMNRFNWNTPKELFFYEETREDRLHAPRGFLSDIIEYLSPNHIQFKINDKTYTYDPINLQFLGKLYPFQKTAVEKMLRQNIGTLCAPTGSGKTVMGIYMIAERQQPTLIIIHTKELLYQWKDRIWKFLDISNHEIGIIGDGHLDENKDITIALVQTLRNYPQLIDQYSYLIIDECHRIPSKTFTNIASQFSGKFITGLSATPYRRDGLSKAIEWYAGKIRHTIRPKDLIKEGHITSIKSIIRKTNFVSQLYNPADEYSKLLQELSQDKERNEMIANDITKEINRGEICLVLSDRKAHCQELKEMLSAKCDALIEILNGDVPNEKRKEIVRQVNNGEVKILIATGQLIGEGFDCKNLSALFLTLPIKFSGRIIQYIGRVLRPKKNKDKALVYDYFDHNIRCLYNGFKARKKEYEKLEI